MSTNARFSIADNLFLGHEEQIRDFSRLITEGLFGHAYLFFGDEGVGKFRVACALANFLEHGVWESRAGKMFTDALVVECGKEETSLSIDTVRVIRKFLSTTPFHSSRRTVVIRDAELLTWEAESALLKIVEEPPVHALIIVVARSPEALFPPLVSRMARVYFARMARATLAETLARELSLPAREARALAECSFGRMGYAITLAKSKEQKEKGKKEETLAEKLEALILARWERGVKKESPLLAPLLARLEAASRFNLNPRLQEKAVSYMMNT